MLEVLEFIFRNFWTWLGSVVLLGVAVGGFSEFVKVVVNKTKRVD